MGSENKKTKDLKCWFQRSFSIEEVDINSVIETVLDGIQKHGFEIKERKDLEEGTTIKAIFGSKFIAFLVNLIPFVGRNLPSGKRLGMQASVFKNESIRVNIRISPYMELFNTSEVLVLSQSVDEKATDEYLAAHKLHSITKRIFSDLNLPIPFEFSKFDTKTFAFDAFLNFLIYPLDGYKSDKKIFIPSEKGPRWNWAAFILPEIWFLWNEIWGVSMLAGMIDYFLFIMVANNTIHLYVAIAIFLLLRFGFGRVGNILYFYRYGCFSPSKRYVPPKDGPK